MALPVVIVGQGCVMVIILIWQEVFNGAGRPKGPRIRSHFNRSLAGGVNNGPWYKGRLGSGMKIIRINCEKNLSLFLNIFK